MFFVYLIRSINHPTEIYVGFSTNIEMRIAEHNAGKSPHTNKYKPWRLKTCCAFSSKERALDFERYLKSGSGRAFHNKHLI